MSLVTKGIGFAKKFKHRFQDEIKNYTPVYLSPVRRIERIKTGERVCAMTFDDGPSRLPAVPGTDMPLTRRLVETLNAYEAKGTFDVVGDTSQNYPDAAGKPGSASWGGVSYDHYPDIHKDSEGGAVHCPELIELILAGGHEITSHTYAHVLYGHKPLVYGKRHYLGSFDKVVEDLERLHALLLEKYGYEIKLSRPPHYVDSIQSGLDAYDAYAVMGYQYMAASFDGAGWLPLSSYEAEVEATWKPMEKALLENPDFFCGQIIFQKDGFNMARRTPVADGLKKQLELLAAHGYKVVTVSDLLKLSAFSDLGSEDKSYGAAEKLLKAGWCVAFRDNTVRCGQPVTRGELAMMAFGAEGAALRIRNIKERKANPFSDVSVKHPYSGAISLAVEAGCFQTGKLFRPDVLLTASDFVTFCQSRFGYKPRRVLDVPQRWAVLEELASLI